MFLNNSLLADFYNLFRDTRKVMPVSTEIGAWGGAEFVRMVQWPMARKAKYPDDGTTTGIPY
jgi:arylsulfatase